MPTDDVVGIACVLGAVALFGTNHLPVKLLPTVGDGFFYQWCLCLGIWLVGLAVDLTHVNSAAPPPFEPLAVLGGALWCTGNLAVVTIIQTIGLAKGLIVWGSTAMLAGWACGVFGLLGVRSQAEAVHSWPLNLGGLALCLLSLCTSLLLRPTVGGGGGEDGGKDGGGGGGGGARVRPTMLEQRLLPSRADEELSTAAAAAFISSTSAAAAAFTNAAATATATASSSSSTAGPAWLRAMHREQRSAVGVGLALLAGVSFGTNFNPSQYVIDRAGTTAAPHASRHSLDYVHAQFSGIALASTVYFGLYCAYMRNRPVLLPQVVLPALASGIMWGVGDALWFVANEKLGFVVAFPIVLAGPGIVASLWGIFLLRELEGTRNFVLTAIVAVLVMSGAACISASRV